MSDDFSHIDQDTADNGGSGPPPPVSGGEAQGAVIELDDQAAAGPPPVPGGEGTFTLPETEITGDPREVWLNAAKAVAEAKIDGALELAHAALPALLANPGAPQMLGLALIADGMAKGRSLEDISKETLAAEIKYGVGLVKGLVNSTPEGQLSTVLGAIAKDLGQGATADQAALSGLEAAVSLVPVAHIESELEKAAKLNAQGDVEGALTQAGLGLVDFAQFVVSTAVLIKAGQPGEGPVGEVPEPLPPEQPVPVPPVPVPPEQPVPVPPEPLPPEQPVPVPPEQPVPVPPVPVPPEPLPPEPVVPEPLPSEPVPGEPVVPEPLPSEASEAEARETEADRLAREQAADDTDPGMTDVLPGEENVLDEYLGELETARDLLHDLPYSRGDKAVAVAAGRSPKESGWTDSRGYEGKVEAAERAYAERREAGRDATEHFRDPQEPAGEGLYYEMHAERQAARDGPDRPVAVNKKMCPDCESWFGERAVDREKGQVVADPEAGHLFLPDGRHIVLPHPAGTPGPRGPVKAAGE